MPLTPVVDEPAEVLRALVSQSLAVAYARFGPDGSLTQANPGFLALIGGVPTDCRLPLLVVEEQQEFIEELLRERQRPDGSIHLHIGAGLERAITLQVTMDWVDDDLVMLGAPPADDSEAAATLGRLNIRVSELARENARNSAALTHRNEALGTALEDLRASRFRVRQLKELLPICAHCGKVRTGEDHWQSVEAYLAESSDFLTHGVCPECFANTE